MVNSVLKKHPSYTKLLNLIEESKDKQKYLPIIEVLGLTPTLYDSISEILATDLKQSVITLLRDSQESRRYISSAILFKFKESNASQLLKSLIEYGYKRTDKVQELGEYSVKGDILSFWPPGFKHPIRVSMFGEEIESATFYDEIYGRTYFEATFFLLGDLGKYENRTQYDQITIVKPEYEPANCFLIFGGDNFDTYESSGNINFDFVYPALYFNRFDLLLTEIEKKVKSGYQIKVYTNHTDAIPKELHTYLEKEANNNSGYESSELKLLVLTDKELFGTVFLGQEVKKLSSERARKVLANLEGELEIGDYVVHEDHGVGIYKGIKQEEYEQEIRIGVGEKITRKIKEDYILIGYAQEDELYVPLRQVDKLTKYISIDDQEPEITRLGKTDWESIRQRTKESIFAMAKELVDLYAKRELAKAPSIDSDISAKYSDFVNSFQFRETPDQKQTERDILKDLSQEKPMNRIIVGDVGFGKTEIAMRAAFKVVESGLQVVVLCPTTVLTAQHEKVFVDRFKGFGFKVASLSRLNTAEQKGIIRDISKGQIDIVIGTHRLLSNDIAFKDLGLIIVDEEQKFGVKQKEKLKQLQIGVHVLSMSATPIPRSLSMALSSIQEISIIQTPPEGRKAIQNIVTKTDIHKIKEAINFELRRKGQVYFVHNRVETIASATAKITKLIPNSRVISAHGQMSPHTLTKNVGEFYQGNYDILVCTTIIENGLDMPNVNTIIVEHAQNFGLGQMYQLRGRVGRGDKQAYAYFLYDGDEIEQNDAVTEASIQSTANLKKYRERRKYKKRLQAIKDSNELGAGFKLASRDLEIRGAGNLLGKQQHGNIKQIGYALYMQMLAEEIEKLKIENQ